MAVPALPRNSAWPGTCSLPWPVTTNVVSSGSSMVTPINRSALDMCRVSSLFSAPVRRLVPVASAASSKARLVMDLEPGGVTFPRKASACAITVTVFCVFNGLRS
ncbi:hypothetical protein D3C76_1049480 [compost metagenome]